jgi:hypothetical protein
MDTHYRFIHATLVPEPDVRGTPQILALLKQFNKACESEILSELYPGLRDSSSAPTNLYHFYIDRISDHRRTSPDRREVSWSRNENQGSEYTETVGLILHAGDLASSSSSSQFHLYCPGSFTKLLIYRNAQ